MTTGLLVTPDQGTAAALVALATALLIAPPGMPEKFVPVRAGAEDQDGVAPPTRTPPPEANRAVAPAAVWYGILPAAPPARWVAVVADVADVADVAFPESAPVNVVAVTAVSPAKLVTVAPRATEVLPMVTEELTSPPLGIPDRFAPEPEKPVADKMPVLGMNESLVDEVFCPRFPVVAVTQVGYTVVAVAMSFVMAMFVAFVAVPAVVAEPAVPAEPSMDTPVRDSASDARFRATAVVPMFTV